MVIQLLFKRLSTRYICIGDKEEAVHSSSVRSKSIVVQLPNEYVNTMITPAVLGAGKKLSSALSIRSLYETSPTQSL